MTGAACGVLQGRLSRRAALIRSWISGNLGKMPGHFYWSDARESIHPPAKFSLYLDPLAPDDGPSIDAIKRIPSQFLNDWIRERICAAQAHGFVLQQDKVTNQIPMPQPALQLVPSVIPVVESRPIETEAPKKQAALGSLFS